MISKHSAKANLLAQVISSLAVMTVLAGSASADDLVRPVDGQISPQTSGQAVHANFGSLHYPLAHQASLPRRVVFRATASRTRRNASEERSIVLAQSDGVAMTQGLSACNVAAPPATESAPSHVCVFFGFNDDQTPDITHD